MDVVRSIALFIVAAVAVTGGAWPVCRAYVSTEHRVQRIRHHRARPVRLRCHLATRCRLRAVTRWPRQCDRRRHTILEPNHALTCRGSSGVDELNPLRVVGYWVVK